MTLKRTGFKRPVYARKPAPPVRGITLPPNVRTEATGASHSGDPIPKSGIRTDSGPLKPPTDAQRARWDRIRAEIGCAACIHRGEHAGGEIEIHHLPDPATGRRAGHDISVGLHRSCHQNGTAERPARHPMQGGRVMFERALGCTEYDLLELTNQLLAIGATE